MVGRKNLYDTSGVGILDDSDPDFSPIASIPYESAEFGHYENDGTAKRESKTEKIHNATRQYLDDINDISSLLDRADEMHLGKTIANKSVIVKREAIATGYGARRVLHLLYQCLDGQIKGSGGRYSPFGSPGRKVLSYGRKVSDTAEKLQPRADDIIRGVLSGDFSAGYERRVRKELTEIRNRISDKLMRLKPEYSIITPIATSLFHYHTLLQKLIEEGSANGELTRMTMEIGDFPEHFRESAPKLKEAYEECENARRALTEGNLRLVVSIAKEYQNRGISLLDLIGYGNVGLIEAVDSYRLDKGAKFATHADYLIRKTIHEALNINSRLIRIPWNALTHLPKFYKTYREMSNDLGREPSPEEMAEKADLPVYVFKAFLREFSSLSPGEEQLYHFGDDESAFLDTRGNTDPVRQAELGEIREIADNLDIILGSGYHREADIIKYKTAFYNDRKHTNLEISKVMGVTKERVRQLEKEAFERLRKKVG